MLLKTTSLKMSMMSQIFLWKISLLQLLIFTSLFHVHGRLTTPITVMVQKSIMLSLV